MKATFTPLVLALLVCPAWAQITFEGDISGAHLGEHFDVIGDINGDGIDDLIAGFPGFDNQDVDVGRTLILSGIDGSTLRTHIGNAAGDRFGSQVAVAGHVDTDGVLDYMVAATGYGPDKGAVYVYSGATGTQLHFMRGSEPGDLLGTSISRAGDVNNDGHEDILIGAPGTAGLSSGSGTVYVVSGADGSPIHILINDDFDSDYGQFVSYLGDVNGDGVGDLLACAPDLTNGGQANGGFTRVLSGADGSTIRQHNGTSDGHGTTNHPSMGVSGVGDITGDGVEDYAIGTMIWWSGFGWGFDFNEGKEIWFHSGASGNFIFSHNQAYVLEDSLYPIQPNNVGDLNGDGIPEMAYVSPAEGLVYVISGATGSSFQVLAAAEPNVRFGEVIRGVGDIDGDGIGEIAVGMPDFDGASGSDSGAIRYLAVPGCPAPSNYCSTTANTSGNEAQIGAAGSTSVTANNFVLTVTGCPPNKPGMFFYGPTQISTPYGDGTLCVGTGSVGYFRVNPVVMTGPSGSATLLLDNTVGVLGSGPGQLASGSTWNFQFWFRDPSGGPNGFTFSDGLEVIFCP